ncbi:MAG TPA: hypothetical protein VGI64_18000 [Streptosporangiaceae bacterium]
MREDPGGGEEVGIDPAKLADLNGTLSRSASSAQSLVNIYIGKASRCGIDTGRLSKAGQDLSWATGQLPMLRRRQELGLAAERQDPGLGQMVAAGAGYLAFPTDAAAGKAGASDGGKAAQALQDRSDTNFIADDLAAHADDPAYLAAFFKALGPEGLAQLGLQVNGFKQSGDDGKYDGWSALVGDGLATASYQMKFSYSWLNDIRLPESEATEPELDLIQPFLENGVYSPDWLKPLGQYAMNEARLQGMDPGLMGPPPSLDGIWEAIAHNPAYDAQFFQNNFSKSEFDNGSLSDLMTNPMLSHSIIDGAFADMVQAATIPPDPSRFPGMDPVQFARNAEQTVQLFQDGSPDTSGPVRQVFATMAMYYFADLRNSVGSAAPGVGGRDLPGWQVTASSQAWGNFVEQAMKDKTAAARLMTFYGEWRQEFPDSKGPWQDEQFKLMDLFMVHQYQTAGSTAGSSNDDITKALVAGGAAFLTAIVFPEADVATAGALLTGAITEGAKDTFNSGAEGALDSAFGGAGDSKLDEPPDKIKNTLDQITQANANWSRIVREWYNAEGGRPNLKSPVEFDGHQSNGDPNTYINEFGGSTGPGNANFFDSQGQHIKDPSDMSPHQLAAYNAWLQDPAIAESTVPGTNVPGQGPKRLWETYTNQFGGG